MADGELESDGMPALPNEAPDAAPEQQSGLDRPQPFPFYIVEEILTVIALAAVLFWVFSVSPAGNNLLVGGNSSFNLFQVPPMPTSNPVDSMKLPLNQFGKQLNEDRNPVPTNVPKVTPIASATPLHSVSPTPSATPRPTPTATPTPKPSASPTPTPAPQLAAHAGPDKNAPSNTPVTFDASGSTDQDGTITNYEWDFNGDGVFEASSSNPVAQWTYPVMGNYSVVLRVSDSKGRVANATVTARIAPNLGAGCNFDGECGGTETQYGCPTDCRISCSNDSDCQTGYAVTRDVCVKPGSLNSYCAHYANRQISMCYGHSIYYEKVSGMGQIFSTVDVIDTQDNFNASFKQQLKAGGHILAKTVGISDLYPGVDRYNAHIGNLSYYTLAIYSNFSRMFDQGFDAIAFDEFWCWNDWHDLMNASSMAIAMLKKAYPTKMIFTWESVSGSNCGDYLNRTLTYTDFFMPERYLADSQQGQLSKLYDRESSLISFNGAAKEKILIGLAANDVDATLSFDRDPGVDFRKFLDYEMSMVQSHTASGLNKGVAIFSCGMLYNQTYVWLGQLFQHYILQNQMSALSAGGFNLSYISNPGFEQGTTGWTVSNGSGGSVQPSNFSNPPEVNPPLIILGYPAKLPEGNRVLAMTRGATPSSVNQTALLEPGKVYHLEVYSKKHSGDFGNSSIRTRVLDASGADVAGEAYLKYSSCLARPYSWYRGISKSDCFAINYSAALSNGTSMQFPLEERYWMKEDIVFTAPSSAVLVSISDAQAQPGEVNLVDFVQLQQNSLG